MSGVLAISAVSAVLQSLLGEVYNSAGLGTVTVSAVSPDIVQKSFGVGAGTGLQVNIFMHQVTYNAAWRNNGLASLAPDGITPLKNPPLALDLHYLLTAYAAQDTMAEALLGYGLLFLHQTPVWQRGLIRNTLNGLTTQPLAQALRGSGLADQIEMIKITPATLGKEEIAWLWTALKADYRPTFPFQVSVVLIEPQAPVSSPLPVLSRNIIVQAGIQPPFPQLSAVQLPPGQSAATPGQSVTVTGQFLTGTSLIALSNQRLGIQYPPFAPGTVTSGSISFTVPDSYSASPSVSPPPAGIYGLTALFTDASGTVVQTTNSVPLAIGPGIVLPIATPIVAGTTTQITIECDPPVLPNQSVSLSLGAITVPAQAWPATTPGAPATSFEFLFPGLTAGDYLARLRVDGVDSPVTIDLSATPPVFTGPFVSVP